MIPLSFTITDAVKRTGTFPGVPGLQTKMGLIQSVKDVVKAKIPELLENDLANRLLSQEVKTGSDNYSAVMGIDAKPVKAIYDNVAQLEYVVALQTGLGDVYFLKNDQGYERISTQQAEDIAKSGFYGMSFGGI